MQPPRSCSAGSAARTAPTGEGHDYPGGGKTKHCSTETDGAPHPDGGLVHTKELRHHGARSLLTRLSTCLHSTVPSLRGNELGPEGGAALAEGLKGNLLLQSLE